MPQRGRVDLGSRTAWDLWCMDVNLNRSSRRDRPDLPSESILMDDPEAIAREIARRRGTEDTPSGGR